jgi:Tfp pilus assembly protein PilN
MNRVNLIPMNRRRAKARRVRMRAWIAIDGVIGVIAVVAAGFVLAASAVNRAPTNDLAKISDEIARSNKQLQATRIALAEGLQTLASTSAASDQPDWSLLLAALAGRQGDDIVLSRCEISPVKDEGHAPLPASPTPPVQAVSMPAKPAATPALSHVAGHVLLHVSGLGRSQAAVAQFVLQLEASDLFERVTLLQTTRQEFLGGEAMAFELDCPLRGRTGGGQ